jgi:hypothetical protein
MKTKINRFIFEQIGSDSGSLNVLSSIIHKFSESGQYYGFLYKGRENIGKFGILVKDINLIKNSKNDKINHERIVNSDNDCQCNKKENTQSEINIDLYKIDTSILGNSLHEQEFEVVVEGYALFYISRGSGGYYLKIYKAGDKGSGGGETLPPIFDSQNLGNTDFFTATILRPGTYTVTDIISGGKANLTVLYPQIGKIPKRPEPLKIKCTKNIMIPSDIRIHPTQSLVFSFEAKSRIKIELVKPEDRQVETRQERFTLFSTEKSKKSQQEKYNQDSMKDKSKVRRRLKIASHVNKFSSSDI